MNKILLIIFTFLIFSNCSLNENSKIWNKEIKKKEVIKNQKIKKINNEKKQKVSELNPNLKLDLSKIKINHKTNNNLNNSGALNYLGKLDKSLKFKFNKFKNYNQIDLIPLYLEDGLVFFDNKGTITRYDNKNKIIWKKNYYSKSEKKLNPKLSFSIDKNNLIVADTVSKIYSLNLLNGNLIWSKNTKYPFNSEIKIYKNKFFVIDYNNALRCFFIKDGSNCWNLDTQETFTVSNSKYSIIISNDQVVFNNSIGDITAVNVSTGLINWQLPTQKSTIINETFNFKFSKLISDGKTIFFSNNKNQFYSISQKTGNINWINDINSSITPIIIGELIFTISENGYLYTLQKKEGNIIRVIDIYKNTKKRNKFKTLGFAIGKNQLYLTNTDNKLFVIDLSTGKVLKIKKISGNIISAPFIHRGNLFLLKNGSIVRYN